MDIFFFIKTNKGFGEIQSLSEIENLTCFYKNDTTTEKYLLLNNELKIDARITGFEINVCIPGEFRLLVNFTYN